MGDHNTQYNKDVHYVCAFLLLCLDLYSRDLLKRYGMIKALIWRALRLIIDTGLHNRGMSRDQALQLFAEYLWEESDVMEKEVSRYQVDPGQATSYMIGRQAIWKMRNETENQLGNKFNLKDFHYHLLRQGDAPLPYIESYMKKYVNCALKPDAQSCAEMDPSALNRAPRHVASAPPSPLDEELMKLLPQVIFRF